ncbi:MAG: hypothetical protein KDB16_05095, partial [Acidimicrobiales bacterium]|nr:hypothetical protein [Acidimicrobiales bacterium]
QRHGRVGWVWVDRFTNRFRFDRRELVEPNVGGPNLDGSSVVDPNRGPTRGHVSVEGFGAGRR